LLVLDCQVANAKRILTAPALLESTSLVFVYGLDLFLTRVAPSGTFDVLSEDFNKVQLVLTIIGLAVAIIVTKPMVQQKRLRERWYQ
jgi:ER membrane protein complex subunit 1